MAQATGVDVAKAPRADAGRRGEAAACCHQLLVRVARHRVVQAGWIERARKDRQVNAKGGQEAGSNDALTSKTESKLKGRTVGVSKSGPQTPWESTEVGVTREASESCRDSLELAGGLPVLRAAKPLNASTGRRRGEPKPCADPAESPSCVQRPSQWQTSLRTSHNRNSTVSNDCFRVKAKEPIAQRGGRQV